jgi:hypothetical protein
LPFTFPPKLPGTGNASPVKKISSHPLTGTVVIEVLVRVSKLVEAHVAVGEKVIWALGTGRVKLCVLVVN